MRNDIVLASASPRRIEMFRERGIQPRVVPADVEEHLPFDMPAETAVMYLALTKALDVASREHGLIVAADTVVVCDGKIIGKPADEEDAFETLRRLRNRTHQVITGACLIDSPEAAATDAGAGASAGIVRKHCLYEVTDVTFGTYTDAQLRAYVQTPEPYDKAGGYAIQETFGRYIDHIDGDLDNVIGFPMSRVLPYLQAE